MDQREIISHNKTAWNRQVEQLNRWTVAVSPEEIARAREGYWELLLTPSKPVPRSWYPELAGCDVLCLASGGGQQGPILAAAGARVTVFDNSPGQLAQDHLVAEREGLDIVTHEGDMANLARFQDESFDLVFHPVSNLFVPEIRPVWREAYRVLRPGGVLLSGFCSPVIFIFDLELYDQGILQAKYEIPYSDLTSLDENEREKCLQENSPIEFGHSLEDQIAGQLDAGFVITGLYEDADPDEPVSKHLPGFVATRAIKA
jgi:SAM-dependent methyltransferase